MKIEAVKIRRLYLEIASQVEKLIRDGEIKSGERLPSERDLAESFGVSRPTVREAMIALEIAGLVEIRTGSGIYAVAPQAESMPAALDDVPGPFEILEARLLVEAETVTLAASRITEQQLETLEKAVAVMADESSSEKDKEKADQLFHCTIAAATNNSALQSTVKWLWDLRNKSPISAVFHQRVRDLGVHPSVQEHRRILSALKNRDAARARSAMQVHISNAIEQDVTAMDLED